MISDDEGLGAKEVKDAPGGAITWLADGRLAWRTVDARNYQIRDLASGGEELLVTNPEVGWVFEPQFSPRGDQVWFFWNRTEGPDPKHNKDSGCSPGPPARHGRWRRICRLEAFQGSLGMSDCSLTPDRQSIVCAVSEKYTDAWIVDHFDRDMQVSGR